MPTAKQIVGVLKALGGSDAAHSGGQWVTCRCLLARWTHQKKKDTTASFGVNLKSANFNCFACQSGTLEDLVGALELYEKKDPSGKTRDFARARDLISGIDLDEPLPEYGATSEIEVFYPWSEFWLDTFVPATQSPEGQAYLASRLVTPEHADRYDLRWDPERKMIVCPFRNVWGQLAGARGRAVNEWAGLQHYDYKFNGHDNSGLVFYNEQVLQEAVAAHRPIVIVEGQFDLLAVTRVYPYVVANLTAKPTPHKLATLNNCPDGVLLMLDNDDPGKQAAAKWAEGIKVPCGSVSYDAAYKDPAKIPLLLLPETLGELVSI